MSLSDPTAWHWGPDGDGILSAVGDITRFPSTKKLVGYAGLGARVHSSGLSHTGGALFKVQRLDTSFHG